jgi:peptidoglycan hydrolase-like protein with peptidoglycan-binding domain
MTTTPFPMKRYLLLIGVAFSLAVCTEGQVLPTEQSVAYHANPPIVRKVQIALRNRGYYHKNVDGYLGGATGIAIQRYQIDHSIRVIPLLDPSLLISLGITREY